MENNNEITIYHMNEISSNSQDKLTSLQYLTFGKEFIINHYRTVYIN